MHLSLSKDSDLIFEDLVSFIATELLFWSSCDAKWWQEIDHAWQYSVNYSPSLYRQSPQASLRHPHFQASLFIGKSMSCFYAVLSNKLARVCHCRPWVRARRARNQCTPSYFHPSFMRYKILWSYAAASDSLQILDLWYLVKLNITAESSRWCNQDCY